MPITALGIVGPPGPPGPQGAAGAVEASNTLDVAGGVLTSDGKLTWLTTKRDGSPTDYAVSKLNAAGIGAPPVTSVNGQTGAVNLRLPYLNVRTYGATGDGATNDSAAFASAMTVLGNQGGGTLFIPAGTYRGRFALDKTNVRWQGEGRGNTILKLPDGINGPAQTLTITGDNSGVSDLKLDGNRANQDFTGQTVTTMQESDGIGIYASNVVVQRCHVYQPASHGIIIWQAATNASCNATRAAGTREYIWILDTIVEDNGCAVNTRAAIDFALNNTARRMVVHGCTIKGGAYTDTGVTWHGGAHGSATNNLVFGVNLACFKPHTAATNIAIAGNVGMGDALAFFNTSGGGTVKNITVTGNVAAPDTGNGMQRFASLDDVDGVVVSGNVYRSLVPSATEFVLASGASNVNISGNLQMGANSALNAFLRVDTSNAGSTNMIIRRDNLWTNVPNAYRLDSGADLTGITFEGVNDLQAANPDTSGATLAALETEVNELKAALRAAKILTP